MLQRATRRTAALIGALALFFMLTPASTPALAAPTLGPWGSGKTLVRPAHPACIPKKPCSRSYYPNSPRSREQAAPRAGSDGKRTQPSHATTKKA